MTPDFLRRWITTVKEVITKAPVKQEIFLERLSVLRDRIENWCNEFGYDNQDNYAERKNAEGEIVWFKSDWDYVDGMHNTVYNSHYKTRPVDEIDGFGNDYSYNDETLKRFNKMWRRYAL